MPLTPHPSTSTTTHTSPHTSIHTSNKTQIQTYAYAQSQGTLSEKTPLLTNLDILLFLTSSFTIESVRQTLTRYRNTYNCNGNSNSGVDYGRFGFNFMEFCEVFNVKLYDDKIAAIVSAPGYDAIVGVDGLELIDLHFNERGDDDDANSFGGVGGDGGGDGGGNGDGDGGGGDDDHNDDTKSRNASHYLFKYAERPAISQVALQANEQTSRFDTKIPETYHPPSTTHTTTATSTSNSQQHKHEQTQNQYIQSLSTAAKLFILFAKSSPSSSHARQGNPPERMVDFFETFTLLTLLCRGEVNEKFDLLFDVFTNSVFDVGGSGKMSEDALAMLIQAVNVTLVKLRVGGLMDGDDIDYYSSLAFTDMKSGTTCPNLSREQFKNWCVNSEICTNTMTSLDLVVSLQRYIKDVKVRVDRLATSIDYNSHPDRILKSLNNASTSTGSRSRHNANNHIIIQPRLVFMSSTMSSTTVKILIQVARTTLSRVKIHQCNLHESQQIICSVKCLLRGGIPFVFCAPERAMEANVEYMICFNGVSDGKGEGEGEGSLNFKTPNTSASVESGESQSIAIYSSNITHDNSHESMFRRMTSSDLIIRLDGDVINSSGSEGNEGSEGSEGSQSQFRNLLETLENEIAQLNNYKQTPTLLNSRLRHLKQRLCTKIRAIYTENINCNLSFDTIKSRPTLHYGKPDLFFGLDVSYCNLKWPLAFDFASDSLKGVWLEYYGAMLGDDFNLNLDSGPSDSENDKADVERVQTSSSSSSPSKVIDFGQKKMILLDSPSPEKIYATLPKSTTGRSRFNGKVSLTHAQWRDIRLALKHPSSFDTDAGETNEVGNDVILITTFPIIFNGASSKLDAEGLTRFVSTTFGGSDGDDGDDDGAGNGVLREVSKLRNEACGEDVSVNTNNKASHSHHPSIPLPASTGFDFESFMSEGIDDSGGWGRDESDELSPPVEIVKKRFITPSVLSNTQAHSSSPLNSLSVSVDVDNDVIAAETEAGTEDDNDDSSNQTQTNKEVGGTEEDEDTQITINGKRLGRVRKSLLSQAYLDELLADEQKEQLKIDADKKAINDTPTPATPAKPASPPLPLIKSYSNNVWPDARPRLFYQLAKSQYKLGEVPNALKSLEKAIDFMSVDGADPRDDPLFAQLMVLFDNLSNTFKDREQSKLSAVISSNPITIIRAFFPTVEKHKAFPLPSHILLRTKWKQLKIGIISYALERQLAEIYDNAETEGVAPQLLLRAGYIALSLSKYLGYQTAVLLRVSSILLQKSFEGMERLQSKSKYSADADANTNSTRQKLLSTLGLVHYDAWNAQGIRGEREQLLYANSAYEKMSKRGNLSPRDYTCYASTLIALNKKSKAVQCLVQLIEKYPDDECRAFAELKVGAIFMRLNQFDDVSLHFTQAQQLIASKSKSKSKFNQRALTPKTFGLTTAALEFIEGFMLLEWSKFKADGGGGRDGDVGSVHAQRGVRSKEVLVKAFTSMRDTQKAQSKSSPDLHGVKSFIDSDPIIAFNAYFSDPKTLITLSQLFTMAGEHVLASHMLEYATSGSLDLSTLSGVNMNESELKNVVISKIEMIKDRIEVKYNFERKQEVDKAKRAILEIRKIPISLAEDDVAVLFDIISEFLVDGNGKRSVTIVCNNDFSAVGMVTVVTDGKRTMLTSDNNNNNNNNNLKVERNVSFKQITVGRCGDANLWDVKRSTTLKKLNGTCGANGAFAYEHKLSGEFCQSYAEVKLLNGDVESALICSQPFSERPKLAIGPVIGKVTSASAIVMIELAKPGCSVRVILKCNVTGEAFTQRAAFVKPGLPFSFLFDHLSPNSIYAVHVDLGVDAIDNAQDASARPSTSKSVSKFMTLPTDPCAINFAMVTGNGFNARNTNGVNLWDWMARSVDSDREFSPTVPDFLLHLGGQVDVRDAYDQARLKMQRFRKSHPMEVKTPPALHNEIKELFRDPYRIAWGTTRNVRKVLGNIPSIMLCGVSDIIGTRRHSQLELDPEIAALALQVFREYQGKLNTVDASVRNSEDIDDFSPLCDNRKDSLIAPLGHFHRFGRIGMLSVDTLSSNLFAIARNVQTPLISEEQFEWLTRVLFESEEEEDSKRVSNFARESAAAARKVTVGKEKVDEFNLDVDEKVASLHDQRIAMHSLIIASALPIIWHSPEDAKVFVIDPCRVKNGSAQMIRNSLSYHVDTCGKLLSLLFAWKQMHPGRDVLIVCGAREMGAATTIITDNTTGLQIRQTSTTGIVCKPLFPFEAALTGKIGRRFEYEHTPFVPKLENNKGVLEIMVEQRKIHLINIATIEAQHAELLEQERRAVDREKAEKSGELYVSSDEEDEDRDFEEEKKESEDAAAAAAAARNRPRTREARLEEEINTMFIALDSTAISSRPSTFNQALGRPKTPAEKAATKKDDPDDMLGLGMGLTVDMLSEAYQKLQRYKERLDCGFVTITATADVEHPTFSNKYLTQHNHAVSVTTGPVIGEVSTSGAKVLLECDGAVKVRCIVVKVHNRSNHSEHDLVELASLQQQLVEMKLSAKLQKELTPSHDESDYSKMSTISAKIKKIGYNLQLLGRVVRTQVSKPNVPIVFDFEENSLEPNTKYWVSFEPFIESCKGSFKTLPLRASRLTLNCVFGASRFGGLLYASTPAAYENWSNILYGCGAGGGSNSNRFAIASESATGYYKFGRSYNPVLGETAIVPVYSENPNQDFESSPGYNASPRMSNGWYGGASGIGMGGERGLGAGGNVMSVLDKDASAPRRAPDILVMIGICGVGEMFSRANAEKFVSILRVAIGVKTGAIKGVTKVDGDGKGEVKKASASAAATASIQAPQKKGASMDSSEDDGMGSREKTITDDAYLGLSDLEGDDDENGEGAIVARLPTGRRGRRGRNKLYAIPYGGNHVKGTGGTLGNKHWFDDSNLSVRESDRSVWPPEEVKAEEEIEVDELEKAEEECLSMLQNAYRSYYNLPLHRNVHSNVARLSLFTPDDVHGGLEAALQLEEEECVVGKIAVAKGLHPLAERKLRDLSYKAWMMYSLSLRAPLREKAKPGEDGEQEEAEPEPEPEPANLSIAEKLQRRKALEAESLKPAHQARFLNIGNTSIIGVDVRSRRCSGHRGKPTIKDFDAELLSDDQWRYLKKLFSGVGVKRSMSLVVACETMLVADDIFTGAGMSSKKKVNFGDDGDAMLSKKALSEKQAHMLKELRCDIPLSKFFVNPDPTVQWAFHTEEQVQMLDLLFAWLNGKEGRTLTFVCGGGNCGVETVVTDRTTGKSFKQLCVGTIGDLCRPFDLALSGVVIGSRDRYTYKHSPVSDCVADTGKNGQHSACKDRRKLIRGWSYGQVDILTEPYDSKVTTNIVCRYGGRADSGKQSVACELKRHPVHFEQGLISSSDLQGIGALSTSKNYVARKLVGPVIGKIDVVGGTARLPNFLTGGELTGVENGTVVVRVLIELDAPALVTLVATNVLTGERHIVCKRIVGRMPSVFIFDGLEQGRRYSCEWFGFEKEDCDSSTFIIHTPLDDDPDFIALLISGDRSGDALDRDEDSMWGVIADRTEECWDGTDVIIHCGGSTGGKKDEAFLECLEFLKGIEEEKEKAAIKLISTGMLEKSEDDTRPVMLGLENAVEEELLANVEKSDVNTAIRMVVSEEDDLAADREVRERFRQELRSNWNQPSKARALKTASHIMLRGAADIGEGFNRKIGGCVKTPWGKRCVRLAEEVMREYMRQLWDKEDNWMDEHAHNGVFASWRGGLVGALFVDQLECLNADADADFEVTMDNEMEKDPLTKVDNPLISDAQWTFIRAVLSNDNLMTLVIVGELPFVWESKDEGAKLGLPEGLETDGNFIQDHWAHRPRQLCHLVQSLFEWRGSKKGRCIQMVGGSGSKSLCGFTTRITDNKIRKKEDEGEEEIDFEDVEKDIMQLSLPPLTGPALKFECKKAGTIGNSLDFVHSPLQKNVRGYGILDITVECGDTGNPSDVICTCEARLVSLVNADVNFLSKEDLEYDVRGPSDFDGTLLPIGAIYKIEERAGHPNGLYSKVPRWWFDWGIGMPHSLFEDEIYFKARENDELIEARRFVENDKGMSAMCAKVFVEFHLDDAGRPAALRTMNVGKTEVLLKQIYLAICAVWDRSFEGTNHKLDISFLKDPFVFHYLMKKCVVAFGDRLKTVTGFVAFVKAMFNEGGVMRMSVLCQQLRDSELGSEEEAANKARAKELAEYKKSNEMFEVWLIEEDEALAKLKKDGRLDEFQLRTVDRKTKERVFRENEEANEARITELQKKEAEKVRIEQQKVAKEAADKDEAEVEEQRLNQIEMNNLAETDVDEYDRRLQATSVKQAAILELSNESAVKKRRRMVKERKETRRNDKMIIELPTRKITRKVLFVDKKK